MNALVLLTALLMALYLGAAWLTSGAHETRLTDRAYRSLRRWRAILAPPHRSQQRRAPLGTMVRPGDGRSKNTRAIL
ncbi:hypothetical protein [Nocardia sp. CA-119907]|uniref:hypothetical protein n=1 Tax=Nocardia sp. CA-119907 TaxID=3239973 RepID=UPI003D989095